MAWTGAAAGPPHVAFGWNKDDVRALYVRVADGSPSAGSPGRHASCRWLGEPDGEVRRMLDEPFEADPNWHREIMEAGPSDGPTGQGAGLSRVVRSGTTQG
ncbi:Ivy family c-type lysozyme inhibitor [Pseudomonas sp. GCM10022186]|uniref:Ivy family c-type lysozyme inhibitor n=1 Tax=Pseudomonas sp. GCM10022186 TaxID=3252650 RepID=UPI003619A8F4